MRARFPGLRPRLPQIGPSGQGAGLVWGRGFDWETTLFDVTPLSYCQFGLLPQMHRREQDIDANVRRLLAAAGRPLPPLGNVPNRYLEPQVEP